MYILKFTRIKLIVQEKCLLFFIERFFLIKGERRFNEKSSLVKYSDRGKVKHLRGKTDYPPICVSHNFHLTYFFVLFRVSKLFRHPFICRLFTIVKLVDNRGEKRFLLVGHFLCMHAIFFNENN